MNPLSRLLVWFLASFFFFLAGIGSHSLWDRDEPRYAQATREMVAGGDYVIPHFNGGIRYDKPPLSYWLMSIPMRVFGMNEFGARFSSALFGALRVAMVFWLARRMGCSPRGADVAALVAMLSALLVVISKAATTDSVLTVTILAGMMLHWEGLRGGWSWWRSGALGVALALSGLVKGPVGIGLILLGFVFYRLFTHWESSRSAAPVSANDKFLHGTSAGIAGPHMLVTIGVFCAVGLPWVVAAWQRTDGDFFIRSIGKHVVDRASSALEGHSGPIYYYLPIILLATVPFTPLVASAFAWLCGQKGRPERRFLLSWLVPGLVLFSVVSTKLPHYVAPLIPSLALMAGLWWTNSEEDRVTTPAWLRIATAVVIGLIGVGLPIAVGIYGAKMKLQLPPGGVIALAISGTVLAAGAVAWGFGSFRRGILLTATGWVAMLLTALIVLLPSVESWRASSQMMAALKRNMPTHTRLLASEYQEPSMVFYWGDGVTMLGKKEYKEAFALLADRSTPTALITTADRWKTWSEKGKKNLPSGLMVVQTGTYFRFEQGKWADLIIIGNWATP